VFYLREVLTVEEGEELRGYLTNKPNNKNKRDLDIKVDYEFATGDRTRYAAGSCEYRMYVSYDFLDVPRLTSLGADLPRSPFPSFVLHKMAFFTVSCMNPWQEP